MCLDLVEHTSAKSCLELGGRATVQHGLDESTLARRSFHSYFLDVFALQLYHSSRQIMRTKNISVYPPKGVGQVWI